MSPLSCGQLLNIVVFRMRVDDAVAFRIERYGADWRPVARVAGPTCRVEFAGLGVKRVSRCQYRPLLTGMTLGRTDVTNAAVAMIDVVPMDECRSPGARLVEVGEALDGKLGAVLGGAKQRFGIGVVIADGNPPIFSSCQK